MTDSRPRRVRVSYGTAISLKLKDAAQKTPPTTAYLLWDAGCQGSCSFCPRRDDNPRADRLSRVTWPESDWEDVCRRLQAGEGRFRRICLQTGWNDAAQEELMTRVRDLLALGRPLCVTLHPSQVTVAEKLIESGVECVGIGLDAASPRTYAEHKGRDWDIDLPPLEALMTKRPGAIGIHLIFGLGDTEEEFLRTVDWVYRHQGKVGLFALTPVPGVRRSVPPPDLAAWRRVQVFRYLRGLGVVAVADCRFRNGTLISLPLSAEALCERVRDGEAFRTAGCPDCNRPYYNERPGGVMYNFPRPLTPREAERCLAESGLLTEGK